MRMQRLIRSAALLFVPLVLAACGGGGDPQAPAQSPAAGTGVTEAGGSGEAIAVAEVQMARMIGDTRSSEPATTFAPTDTILAVVLTQGSGSALLAAQWFFGPDRQSIYREEHRIDARGNGMSQFAIAKGDGFPPGEYAVEVSLEGEVVATREFTVQ
jgi:hypothetical protein